MIMTMIKLITILIIRIQIIMTIASITVHILHILKVIMIMPCSSFVSLLQPYVCALSPYHHCCLAVGYRCRCIADYYPRELHSTKWLILLLNIEAISSYHSRMKTNNCSLLNSVQAKRRQEMYLVVPKLTLTKRLSNIYNIQLETV